MSRGIVWLLAISTGCIVANIYYAQPLLADMAREFGLSVARIGAVFMLTQIGMGTGMLVFVPLGDKYERRAGAQSQRVRSGPRSAKGWARQQDAPDSVRRPGRVSATPRTASGRRGAIPNALLLRGGVAAAELVGVEGLFIRAEARDRTDGADQLAAAGD